MALIRINGVAIPNPSDIDRGEFDITRSERTSDGTMVRDVVTTKRRIDITYDFLSDPDYAAIKTLLAGKGFVQVTYPSPGGEVTMTAYPGDITDRAWHTRNGVRWWRDVKFSLIER